MLAIMSALRLLHHPVTGLCSVSRGRYCILPVLFLPAQLIGWMWCWSHPRKYRFFQPMPYFIPVCVLAPFSNLRFPQVGFCFARSALVLSFSALIKARHPTVDMAPPVPAPSTLYVPDGLGTAVPFGLPAH